MAVLRGAVPRGSPLGYVADTLLPLATGLKHAADAAKAANSQLEATQYHALWLQAWGLLPGFCTAASSVPQAFPRLARDLGTVLNSEPELRPTICAALGRLIETSCTLASAPPAVARHVALAARRTLSPWGHRDVVQALAGLVVELVVVADGFGVAKEDAVAAPARPAELTEDWLKAPVLFECQHPLGPRRQQVLGHHARPCVSHARVASHVTRAASSSPAPRKFTGAAGVYSRQRHAYRG